MFSLQRNPYVMVVRKGICSMNIKQAIRIDATLTVSLPQSFKPLKSDFSMTKSLFAISKRNPTKPINTAIMEVYKEIKLSID